MKEKVNHDMRLPVIGLIILITLLCIGGLGAQQMSFSAYENVDETPTLTYYQEYHYLDTSFIYVTTKSQIIVDDLCNNSMIKDDWGNVWEVSKGLSGKYDWLQLRYSMEDREKILNIVFENPYTVETYIYNRSRKIYNTKRRNKRRNRDGE